MRTDNRPFSQDDSLKQASESNPVPVIVEPDGVLSDRIIADQNENGVQIYVTGCKENESGEVTEVRLARYDGSGALVSIHWTDVDNVTCGTAGVQADTEVRVLGKDDSGSKEPDTSKYDSKANAYVPQSSKGAGKPDQVQITKDGKVDQEASLRNASESSPVPVIVEPDGVLSSAIITDQNENGVQIYVTGCKVNEAGEITEVRLARYDDSGTLVSIHWTDPQNVSCGTVAEGTIEIETKDFAKENPEVELISSQNVVRKEVKSFVLFDPFMNGNDDESCEKMLESELGLQREVAKFLGLYDGRKPAYDFQEKALQKRLNEHICMVPFNDIPDKMIAKYPAYTEFQKTGIDGKTKEGKDERFRDYWNAHIAVYDVPVLAVNCHANEDIICLYGAYHGFNRGKFVELGFDFPKMDYAVFLGCNIGNVSGDNFAKTFAASTVKGIPIELEQSLQDRLSRKEKLYKVYPTAVIAADGNTSSNAIKEDDFIVGFETRTSKYAADDNHTYTKFVKGLGYCVFLKEPESYIQIQGTCSNADPSNAKAKWIESTVPVTYLLEEAKKIIRGEKTEEPT